MIKTETLVIFHRGFSVVYSAKKVLEKPQNFNVSWRFCDGEKYSIFHGNML